MVKRDKEDNSKDKHKKKHKNQKGSKVKRDNLGRTKDTSVNLQQDSDDVDVEDERNDTPSSINQSKDSLVNYEENIDVEAEEEVVEERMESKTKVEDQSDEKSTMEIEKPTSSKKPAKKLDNTETLNAKASATPSNSKKTKRRRDSDTSSEEERWLTAVESGKLEEIEDVELRKIKDPKLMTARQRAMYDRNNDTESAPGFSETLLALPTGYKEKEKPQTAEELQKAALKILRRRQQADEKREKDKKKTMERLLKKQESKQRSGNKPKTAKELIPMISYKNTLEGAVIQLPLGVEFPLLAQTSKEPPKQQLCSIAGCNNPKVYNCSKTNLPLCSFACYRKNVQSLKEIIC